MPATPSFSLEKDGFLCPLRAARDGSAQIGEMGTAPLCSRVLLRSALTDHWMLPSDCLKRNFLALLMACTAHFLIWFWFSQTVSRSGTERHLSASFTNSPLRSRQLLKAPLRCQSYARTGRTQAEECQRANKQRLLTDDTGPLLRQPLISIIASPGSKRNKNPRKPPSAECFPQKIDETSPLPAIPGLLGYKSRCNMAAKAPRHENSLCATSASCCSTVVDGLDCC